MQARPAGVGQVPSSRAPQRGVTPASEFGKYPKQQLSQPTTAFRSYPSSDSLGQQAPGRGAQYPAPQARRHVCPPFPGETPERYRRYSDLNLEYLNKPAWRRKLRLASFKGQPFYVEQQGRTSGRRTVVHQYPKRDLPYSEDMGREALHYAMTGYLLMAPNYVASDFYGNGGVIEGTRMPSNYDDARDNLETALLSGGPGRLVDPYNPRLMVGGYGPIGGAMLFMCEKYTITESRERGGYCVVEMSFVEYGQPGQLQSMINTVYTVATASDKATSAAASQLNDFQSLITKAPSLALGPFAPLYRILGGTLIEKLFPPKGSQ
jgi:DNA circularisation protein N-terminus